MSVLLRSLLVSSGDIASLLVSTAALIAAIAGNVIFAIQARELRAQSEELSHDLGLSAQRTVNDSFLEIGRVFIEHPRLRIVFYPDESSQPPPPLTEEDRLRAATLCEHILDAFEQMGAYKNDKTFEYTTEYEKYLDALLTRSDFLYTFLERHAEWYPQLRLRAEALRSTRADSDETSPPGKPASNEHG